MKSSLAAAFRLFAALVVLSVLAAIAVARLAGPPVRSRANDGIAWVGLNGNHFRRPERQPTFLDPKTGACRRLDMRSGEEFEYTSCSPWRDEDGQTQVVGRWSKRRVRDGDVLDGAFGLARFTFPGGEVLDRIETDPIPAGRPCWFPGTSARFLFAAGDGQLYRFSFEDPQDDFGPGCGDTRAPRALPWTTPPPGVGGLFITDPSWPDDPRLGRKVLVALSFLEREDGPVTYTPAQIWWLQLSPDATSIDRAGRLTRTSYTEEGEQESECMPILSAAPDGGIVLAYLSRSSKSPDWDLRVVPLALGGPSGSPIASASASIRVAEHCAPVPPAFSADGRWIFGVLNPWSRDVRIGRFSVTEALATAPPPPIRLANRGGTRPAR